MIERSFGRFSCINTMVFESLFHHILCFCLTLILSSGFSLVLWAIMSQGQWFAKSGGQKKQVPSGGLKISIPKFDNSTLITVHEPCQAGDEAFALSSSTYLECGREGGGR